jgi:NADH-quinone oxidoreductase subunit H
MDFYLLSIIKAAVVAFVLLTALAYIQWAERKVIAHVQLRMGPYRVGPHGLLQPLADVIKLITKEDLIPPHVNKFFYLFAPFMAVALALLSIAVIPFGPKVEIFGVETYLQLTDLNFGLLFVLAVGSLGVYGLALAGWASNSKYALLGGLRSAAQMVSYELPMALAVASPLLLANTLSLRELAESQQGFIFGFLPNWMIFQAPAPQFLAFVMFVIAGFAETNRLPFDLPEAETELVAGFHTEYSSMKFAAFFMAEYCNMVTVCCVATILFLGGWYPPFPEEYGSKWIPAILHAGIAAMLFFHASQAVRWRDKITYPLFGVVFVLLTGVFLIPALHFILLPIFWFVAKVGFLLFFFIWVRATLPRFRYDQLMSFSWKFLLLASMAHLMVTGLVVALVE